jgi:hypothetical protein
MSALSLLHPNKQTLIAAAARNLPGYLERAEVFGLADALGKVQSH